MSCQVFCDALPQISIAFLSFPTEHSRHDYRVGISRGISVFDDLNNSRHYMRYDTALDQTDGGD